MFSSLFKFLKRTLIVVAILMLINAATAGSLIHIVITDIGTMFHYAQIHTPSVHIKK